MDGIYVLYDFDLNAGYNVDYFSEACAAIANQKLAEQEEVVRWIPINKFKSIRRQLVIAIITKEGEYCIGPTTFRNRTHAKEVARKLGGVVKEMVIF